MMGQELVHLDPTTLTPHPENPRRGDVDKIAESIQANGWYGTLIVQKSTNYVIAGNHRRLAAIQLGMPEVPVMLLDVDDDQARRILLADNRTNDVAGYDEEALGDLLREMAETGELAGTGYNADDVDALLESIGANVLDPDEFLGGYAESDEETAERQGKGGVPKSSKGLREIVLVYTADDYEVFAERVREARKRYLTETTSETVLAMTKEWS